MRRTPVRLIKRHPPRSSYCPRTSRKILSNEGRALNEFCQTNSTEVVTDQSKILGRRGKRCQNTFQINRVVRQCLRPGGEMNSNRFAILAVEPLAFSGDQFHKLLITHLHNIAIQRAAKNPGLRMRRTASVEDAFIEQDAPARETLRCAETNNQSLSALPPQVRTDRSRSPRASSRFVASTRLVAAPHPSDTPRRHALRCRQSPARALLTSYPD